MVSRRHVLIGGAVGGGLLVGWGLLPRHYPLPMAPGPGEYAFDAWLRIGQDGTVTVAIPQLEMGQGVMSILAQIVAVELGADWRQVAVEMAPVSAIWANLPLAAQWAPLWMPATARLAGGRDSWLVRRWAEDHRFMVTGEGSAVEAYEAGARAAAASARAVLAMAAARRWGVGWDQCAVAGGFVSHGARRLPFAALVAEAAQLTPPSPPPLRARPAAEDPAASPSRPAPAFPRLDLPAKVDGSWQFAADVRLPDMVHAAIRHAPRGRESTMGGYDPARAQGLRGFLRLVEGPGWLAAVGSDWWAAERALAAIAPRFAVRHPADSADIAAALGRALDHGPHHAIATTGDAAGVLGEHPPLAATYSAAPALHATPETASATVRLRDGRAEIWMATQTPERLRQAVARALNIVPRKVILYPMAAGGSFDARYDIRVGVEAALIAQDVGRPVQLSWSRWQEHVAGMPRAPMIARMAARADGAGALIAWRARVAMPATCREFGRRMFEGVSPTKAARIQDNADPLAMAGAMPPYAIAHAAIEHAPAGITLPTGRMRGGVHALHAFAIEGFVDEIAVALGREPLGFRMGMLGHDPRLAACLQRVSALAGWNGQDGGGRGLACARMGQGDGGGSIAAIVTLRRGEGGLRVERIQAVADIGRIINVDIARQQIEGGLIYGLGLAMGSSTAYHKGLPMAGRLRDLGLPVLADCPQVEVDLIAGNADPHDPGELGVTVVAPAIANALFSATGLRFRRLPLASDEVE